MLGDHPLEAVVYSVRNNNLKQLLLSQYLCQSLNHWPVEVYLVDRNQLNQLEVDKEEACSEPNSQSRAQEQVYSEQDPKQIWDQEDY
jgi:hypothetical protein